MATGTQTPSLDWAVRTDPLTGDELMLKQNKVADSTPSPKEELVPSSLFLNYVLANLPQDDYVNAVALDGTTLELTRIDGTVLTVSLASLAGGGGGSPSVYNNGNDFLFKSFGTGITGTKAGGIGTITVPDGVTLDYVRIDGEVADLNPSNEFIIRIIHSGNTGNGYGTINDNVAGLYVPSHIGIIDRSIDTVSPPPAASDATPYTYNVGSVSKGREIIDVGSGTVDIRLLNMNSFLEWSLILSF